MHRTKSERIHHKNRIKKRVIKYVKNEWGYKDSEIKELVKFSETRQRCSCYMCGNQRKHFNKKTIQEQREEQDDLDYNLNEISNLCLQQ